jgi:hypothetical protein
VVDVKGDGLRLTTSADGVVFDIDATGKPVRTAWTTAGSDDAFLVLDINLNGRIDDGSEMAGDGLRAQDGSRVPDAGRGLVVLQGFPPDAVQGPKLPHGIGSIDNEDDVFFRLRLWTDVNHDGRSDPSELKTLPAQGVRDVCVCGLRYQKPQADEQGNKTLLLGFITWFGVERDRQMNLITLAH